MRKGNREVKDGLELAEKAGEALAEIMDGTDKTVDLITQIAAASEEQSTNSEMISQSVEMITAISMEAAQGVSMIASATDGLNTLTGELRQLLSSFKLKDNTAVAQGFSSSAFSKSNENTQDASSGDLWGQNDAWGDGAATNTQGSSTDDLWGDSPQQNTPSDDHWGDGAQTSQPAPADDHWGNSAETSQPAPANDLWGDSAETTPNTSGNPSPDRSPSPGRRKSDRVASEDWDRGPAVSSSDSLWED